MLRVEDTHAVSERKPWSMFDQAMAFVSSHATLSGDDDDDFIERLIATLLSRLNKEDPFADPLERVSPHTDMPSDRAGVMHQGDARIPATTNIGRGS